MADQLQDHVVVELTGVGDLVLQFLELVLQIHEVLVGLQLRICLSRGLQVERARDSWFSAAAR